jgi:serine/threonine protein phosphatase PrpC
MIDHLSITVGQYSDKGRKDSNQDFHGVYLPKEPQLSAKGIAVAVADGISSSEVSHIASQAAVTGFLEDYFCTSEAWSVKKSVQKVLTASNSWLYTQTRQSRYCYDKDRGYVCTLSAMVIKSTTAYIFHVGDSRIYRLHGQDLEQLTEDHRLWISQEKSYLSRAMGMDSHLEIDYQTTRSLSDKIQSSDNCLTNTDC